MGKLAEIKTKETTASVESFIESLPDEQKKKDTRIILQMMEKATKEKPKMWGSSMIGFGNKRYKTPSSGREVDWFIMGFSPKKSNLSLHIGVNVKLNPADLEKLGKHKAGVGCVYINRLDDVDLKVLEKMIKAAMI